MDCSSCFVVLLAGAAVDLGHEEDLLAVAVLSAWPMRTSLMPSL